MLPAAAAVVRFETPPGRQAQFDFARFRFDLGIRYALLVVLGYSRVLWCRFYRRAGVRMSRVGRRRRPAAQGTQRGST